MSRPPNAVGRVPAVRDGLFSVLRVFNHGEHDPLWARIEGLLGPHGGGLRQAENGRSQGSGEGAEAVQSLGDAAVAVLHVDDDEIVAGEAGDLGESGGEGAEEEAVEGIAIVEARFEGRRTGRGGGEVAGGGGGDY